MTQVAKKQSHQDDINALFEIIRPWQRNKLKSRRNNSKEHQQESNDQQ